MNKSLEDEFVELIDVNQNILHKICKLYTHDMDGHQDLFQEMVIQLWKSYPKFNHSAKFTTWMYRVALNTAITLHRSTRRKVVTTELDSSSIIFKDVTYDSEKDEQVNKLYQAVRQLNDIEKALIYMYLEDKDYAEISETLGITEVNARVKMNRAKNKLRELVKEI